MSVSVLALRWLMAELTRRELDLAKLWLRCPVNPSELLDIRRTVTDAEFSSFYQAALEVSGDPALGASVAEQAPEATLQMLSHLAMSSRSLSDAAAAFDAHARLLTPGMSVRLSRDASLTRVMIVAPNSARDAAARFVAEVVVGGWVALCRRISPASDILGVSFAHPTPMYATRYAQAVGCPVWCGREWSGVLLRGDPAEQNPFFDTVMHGVISEAAQHLLDGVGLRLVDRLQVVLSAERNLCGIDTRQLALLMGMSQRTLRRRIRAEGARASDIIGEARIRRACTDLLSPGRSIKEVAEQLGYSEASSFHRAFRRWMQQTPAAFIRARKAGAASTTA
jgi:AraC-like DNA-binding protein